MMSCHELTTLASDFIENRLRLRQRLAVLVHIAMCKGCRTYLRQLRLTILGLRKLGQAAGPSSPIDPDLMEHFRKTTRRKDD